MIQPHGGKLVDRVLKDDLRKDVLDRARVLPKLRLDADLVSDVENIATGVYSPLQGFLGARDFQHVLRHMRLANDVPWTVPIVLDVDKDRAAKIKDGAEILLTTAADAPVARLTDEEPYGYDKAEAAERIYGTTDVKHPGVARLQGMGEVLLAGPVDLLDPVPTPYDRWKLTPKETRILFREKGWRTVVGFQTRNTPHNGHEYVQKAALTFTDGIFINPVIGRKKKGDFRDEVILASYEELIKHYYLRQRAVMAILQMEMRYAGPREAIHHAIIRKNFGCTHIIIGRDHAGVGSFYAPYAAQDIFEEFPDLGIVPLFFRAFYYCKRCASVVNDKICPHPASDQIQYSGTKIRDMLVGGQVPPAELMRPEVAKIIMEFKDPFNA